jgi:hypothetical protein
MKIGMPAMTRLKAPFIACMPISSDGVFHRTM